MIFLHRRNKIKTHPKTGTLYRRRILPKLLSISLCTCIPVTTFATNQTTNTEQNIKDVTTAESNNKSLPSYIRFKHLLTEADDVSVGSVLSIYQDNLGLMWIGGRSGLARYDGYDFVTYEHEPNNPGSLGANTINDITQDHENNLWIATQNGLELYNYDTNTFIHYKYSPDDDSSISDNLVMGLYVDKKGTLWLNTKGGLNSYNPESNNFTRYPRNENEQLLAGEYVLDMHEDKNGVYYLATGYGFKVWNPKTGEIKVYTANGENPWNMPHTLSRTVFVDNRDRIWLGTEKGLTRFHPDKEWFEFYPTKMDPPGAKVGDSIWDILEDSHGVLWVTTDGQGLNYLNPDSNTLEIARHRPNDPDSISSDVVRVAFETSTGDIWAGNYPSGVNVFERYGSEFRTQRKTSDKSDSLSVGNVRSIAEDEKGNLWLATDAGGLNYFNTKTLQYDLYRHEPDNENSLGSDDLMWVMLDNDDWLWIATWSSGITKFHPETKTFKRYGGDLGVPNSSLTSHTWSIHQGRSGTIWVANLGGGVARYWPETDSFTFLLHEKGEGTLPDGQVWVVQEDVKGYLWVGTRKGLGRKNPFDDKFTNFVHDPKDPNSLRNDNVLSLYEDSKNRLWIGTQGGGLHLYNEESETFKSINKEDGLISNVIRSIIEDEDGNIWVGTDKGISSYNPITQEIKSYDRNNGLQGNNFNIGGVYKASNGDLIFGGIEGFSRFDPRDVVPNTFLPPVVLTDVLISNASVPIGGEDPTLEKSIIKADKMKLDYTQNIVSFIYSGLNYRIPERNQYAYKLEGFDDDWHYVKNERKATYTNLDAGTYTFKVKASNNEGMWNEESRSLTLIVEPPPWKTWWAYTSYFFAIAGVIFWYVHTMRKKLELERSVVQRLTNLDKHKDEYLANTSHELRTPLFGIIGLAEGLSESLQGVISKMDLNNLYMIIESGKRLSTIVEDVLDFSNIRNHTLKIDKKNVDLSMITKFITLLTQPLVPIDKVSIVSDIPPEFPAVYADEDRLQQILQNLIGNAIKFTESGKITIDAKEEKEEVIISVSDTGCGIAEQHFKTLFDSFSQVDESSTRRHGGTGLGLAITKNLVQLHGGKIWVESKVGEGSTFFFTLPKTNEPAAPVETFKLSEHVAKKIEVSGYSSRNILDQTDTDHYHGEENVVSIAEGNGNRKNQKEKNQHFKIMIVDDENVNRRVLRNHLASNFYQTIEASTGQEALAQLQQHGDIDLIILDVMMPLMSGYEVCEIIRKTHSKLNLPILFITAKQQAEDLLLGFKYGGNDFLSKPISRSELIARVELHLQLLETGRDMEKKIQERTEDLEIANQKLKQLSQSDPLTGLKNRRFLENNIATDVNVVQTKYKEWFETISSASSQHQPLPEKNDLAFFIIDIDHFKNINDTYGHAAGDEVIVEIANILKLVSRDDDYIVRWGGEEFVIVARFISRDQASELAERIRSKVESNIFDIGEDRTLRATCSVGFAAFPLCIEAPEAYSWNEVIEVADTNLYSAKLSGRNGWVGIKNAIPKIQLDTDLNILARRKEITLESSFASLKFLTPNTEKKNAS